MVKNKPSTFLENTDFVSGQVFDFYKPHDSAEISNWGPSLTRQEFAEECDINFIMSRYETTGQLPQNLNAREPQYIDLTSVPQDYQSALELLRDAETAFMRLPATVRREFDNDPRKFVDFASDPENLSQMQTWGLASTPEPVVVDIGAVHKGPEPVAPGSPEPAPKPS